MNSKNVFPCLICPLFEWTQNLHLILWDLPEVKSQRERITKREKKKQKTKTNWGIGRKKK